MLSTYLLCGGPQGSLVDPLGFGSLRLRFKSGWSHFVSIPTQLNLAERWTVDPNVAGTSPAVGILLLFIIYFHYEFYFRIFNFLKIGKLQTFIYNNKYIILMSIIYTHIVLPWWCRGYHVGLSSPRLGFKSRPGRLTIS